MSDHLRNFAGATRALHWLNAVSVLALILSGWAIYNAAPFYPIRFPAWLTLGGHLTEALRWHFLFMWTFGVSSLALIGLRIAAGRGGPPLWPVQSKCVRREIAAVLRLDLAHRAGEYIHCQRLLYLTVFGASVVAFLSGLALWKPVQLHAIATLFGGYEAARRVHFWAMAAIGGFVVIHLVMVAIVPSTLAGMLLGARLSRRHKS